MVLSVTCFLSPASRFARIGFAISLILCGGIMCSFGGVNHFNHAWLWVAVVLAFLPGGRSRADQTSYCLTFAAAQGMLLSFYTLAGTWKIIGGLTSLARGVEGNFSPRGLALTFADRMLQTPTAPLLGHWFVDHWWLSLPTFVAVIYMQFVAVAVAYRPRLHVVWGLALLLFHLGTFLFMEIIFTVNVLVILVLLVNSPFQEPGWVRWSTLEQLPLIGRVFRTRLRDQRPIPVPAQ